MTTVARRLCEPRACRQTIGASLGLPAIGSVLLASCLGGEPALAAECSVQDLGDFTAISGPQISAGGKLIVVQNDLSEILGIATDTATVAFAVDGRCPRLSADGSTLVLLSEQDLVPGGNLDGNSEVFLFEVATSTYRQVTNTTGDVNDCVLAISGDGERAVFRQSGTLFYYDASTAHSQPFTSAGATNIGFGTFPNVDAAVSADGLELAYVSDQIDGNAEIFRYSTGTSSGMQVTYTDFGFVNHAPTLDATGDRLFFTSYADLVAGENANGGWELFLYTSMGFEQITHLPDLNYTLGYPAASGDGRRVAFTTRHDLTNQNPFNVAQVYLWEEGVGLTQVSTELGLYASSSPAISIDGAHLAFTQGDLMHAHCPTPVFRDGFESGDVSRWKLANAPAQQ